MKLNNLVLCCFIKCRVVDSVTINTNQDNSRTQIECPCHWQLHEYLGIEKTIGILVPITLRKIAYGYVRVTMRYLLTGKSNRS